MKQDILDEQNDSDKTRRSSSEKGNGIAHIDQREETFEERKKQNTKPAMS